jgi:hypothetical protein
MIIARAPRLHPEARRGMQGAKPIRDFSTVVYILFFSQLRGDQEGLFKLVMLHFIFKWYNWCNFRLLMASH